jgi:hypothetical protein
VIFVASLQRPTTLRDRFYLGSNQGFAVCKRQFDQSTHCRVCRDSMLYGFLALARRVPN